MTDSVSFTVAGVPVPQGSTRAFVVKGRAVTTIVGGVVRWNLDRSAR